MGLEFWLSLFLDALFRSNTLNAVAFGANSILINTLHMQTKTCQGGGRSTSFGAHPNKDRKILWRAARSPLGVRLFSVVLAFRDLRCSASPLGSELSDWLSLVKVTHGVSNLVITCQQASDHMSADP
ncbi:hypothetical protein PR003_g14799 [Phytophthora rubi]|uniref:Secreted protein n=1 Tax=Phytophthora rubi TaxID=129364 RepID=A0A6A4F1M5_9STRA|nr:hypothetical protein PR003_g14799 [Phytophthora rubi]